MPNTIDPYKKASDEIYALANKEKNRLNVEKRKLERVIIVAYLNDVLKDKTALQEEVFEKQKETFAKGYEDIKAEIATIKEAISGINSMIIDERTTQSGPFTDFSIFADRIEFANIKGIDSKEKANDVFSSICNDNSERKLLDNKINVTIAIETISLKNKGQNLLKAIKDINVKDNQGNRIDAFAVMNERRGKTPTSFWGLIERIFAKFGEKAPTLGVKSAKAMSKIDHTLFQAKKAADKLPKLDTRDDVDDKIKPTR